MKQREAERQQPRRHAGGQDRQEIPDGMRAAMHLGGEALEMLLDEEEAQELVVGERDRDEPGRGDREKQRSEEHTSELQSRLHLVCRLLLEKKKKKKRDKN